MSTTREQLQAVADDIASLCCNVSIREDKSGPLVLAFGLNDAHSLELRKVGNNYLVELWQGKAAVVEVAVENLSFASVEEAKRNAEEWLRRDAISPSDPGEGDTGSDSPISTRPAPGLPEHVATIQCKNNAICSHPSPHMTDPSTAMKDLIRAIEAKPTSRNLYYNRGVLHHRLGNYYEALQDFCEAVHLAQGVGDDDLIDAAEHHFIEILDQMRSD